jgi:cytochrome b561
MAFREKTAWLTLVTMVIAYAFYFTMIGLAGRTGEPHLLDIIWTFGPIAAVQGLVVIAGSVFLAIQARGEARAPADERDRAIARRAANIAYYVLLVGMILVGVVMPFTETPFKIVNTALLTVVLAEAARYTIVLISYRRGWHG